MNDLSKEIFNTMIFLEKISAVKSGLNLENVSGFIEDSIIKVDFYHKNNLKKHSMSC